MKKKVNSIINSHMWAQIWESMWWIGYISIILFVGCGNGPYAPPNLINKVDTIIVHDTPALKTGYAVWVAKHRRDEYRTEVAATDTLYQNGCLFLFDTINFVYRRVATVSITKTY